MNSVLQCLLFFYSLSHENPLNPYVTVNDHVLHWLANTSTFKNSLTVTVVHYLSGRSEFLPAVHKAMTPQGQTPVLVEMLLLLLPLVFILCNSIRKHHATAGAAKKGAPGRT